MLNDPNSSLTWGFPVSGGAETSVIPLGTLGFGVMSCQPFKRSLSNLGRYKTRLSMGNVRAFPCLSQERRGGSTQRDIICCWLGSESWKRQHAVLQADTPPMRSLVAPANTNSGKKEIHARLYLDHSWVCGCLCPVPKDDLFRPCVCAGWCKRVPNQKRTWFS